jgi:hypothetical protein
MLQKSAEVLALELRIAELEKSANPPTPPTK